MADTKRTTPLKISQQQRERWTRKQTATLWGQPHEIEPYFVEKHFGDGLHLIAVTPLNTRPNYYLVRVDSKWWMDDPAWFRYSGGYALRDSVDPYDHIAEHIDDICEGIEDEVGPKWFEDDAGKEVEEGWPALDDSAGVAWCTAMDMLETPRTKP